MQRWNENRKAKVWFNLSQNESRCDRLATGDFCSASNLARSRRRCAVELGLGRRGAHRVLRPGRTYRAAERSHGSNPSNVPKTLDCMWPHGVELGEWLTVAFQICGTSMACLVLSRREGAVRVRSLP